MRKYLRSLIFGSATVVSLLAVGAAMSLGAPVGITLALEVLLVGSGVTAIATAIDTYVNTKNNNKTPLTPQGDITHEVVKNNEFNEEIKHQLTKEQIETRKKYRMGKELELKVSKKPFDKIMGSAMEIERMIEDTGFEFDFEDSSEK